MRARQMDEVYYYAMIVGIVVVVAGVLYMLDRRSKEEPLVFLDGAKICAPFQHVGCEGMSEGMW